MQGKLKIWFVASTLPAKEKIAASNLENQNIDRFLPLRKKAVRRGRAVVTRQVPLFPGYLFVSPGNDPAIWRSIRGTLGIRQLIGADSRPTALPEGFVEQLAENIGEDGTVSHANVLRPGDNVEISHGVFACNVGELLSIDDRGRVALLLEILSSRITVRTHIDNLLPA
jgi:transcription antitermination factor NusG